MEPINPQALLHLYHDWLFTDIPEMPDFTVLQEGKDSQVYVFVRDGACSPADTELLTKMMQACKLSPDGYSLISIAPESNPLPLIHRFKPGVLLLFGIRLNLPALQLPQEDYQPVRWNGISLLYAEPLPTLAQKPQAKNALWNQGLKPIFGLS